MKKVFAQTALATWLTTVLRSRVPFGKKTPWYRRTVAGNVPWIAPALMAPFALFLLWKAASALWPRSRSESP
jgi:hypothetical protein